MTDKKLTDSEIKKALECCSRDNCFGCPYRGKCHQGNPMIRDALELINRQQAEIEAWKNEYLRACAERDVRIVTTKFTRAEAVKEFADKLKEKVYSVYSIRDLHKAIDKLVKEMVGE